MLRQFAVQPTVPINVPTTTETVVATLTIGSTNGAGVPVVFDATVMLTAGTAATSAKLRIRRGSDTTGTVIADLSNETIAATETRPFTLTTVDTPGDVGGQTYALTIQQGGATGNGTIQYVGFTAQVG